MGSHTSIDPRAGGSSWPDMPWRAWGDTITTLHLWTQVVGKVRLATMPPANHWWNVPLYVWSRGLTTDVMPHRTGAFQIDLDFVHHLLAVHGSGGRSETIELEPMTVARFHARLMDVLASLDVDITIRTTPVEVAEAIPFEDDERHASYDRDHVTAFWHGLLAAHLILARFRGGFIGKASPVHFFWGGFDLAASRFSGLRAPIHPGGIPNCPDWVMEEAYSHEVSSAGWWPTSTTLGPAFYSYIYPQPAGFDLARVRPAAAAYVRELGEFVLPCDGLVGLEDPDAAVLEFLESTYEAGASLAGWDRAELEAHRSRDA